MVFYCLRFNYMTLLHPLLLHGLIASDWRISTTNCSVLYLDAPTPNICIAAMDGNVLYITFSFAGFFFKFCNIFSSMVLILKCFHTVFVRWFDVTIIFSALFSPFCESKDRNNSFLIGRQCLQRVRQTMHFRNAPHSTVCCTYTPYCTF